MFDNMFLLNLPAINLHNINLLYPETNYERAMKSPLFVSGEKVARGALPETAGVVERIRLLMRGR